jgi:F-type H+-transporting ATPase subunit delta
MKENNVASRYAKALLLLSEHQTSRAGTPLVAQLERTLEDLRGLAELVRGGTRVGDLLAHPKVRPDDKRSVLRTALHGRVEPSVVVFADLLLRKHRLAVMPGIVREFEVLVEHAQGVQRARVFSAVPLTSAELDRLHGTLETVTGKRIRLAAIVEPALVGGAYVRIGDRIVDRSVKNLLETIASQLYDVSV